MVILAGDKHQALKERQGSPCLPNGRLSKGKKETDREANLHVEWSMGL